MTDENARDPWAPPQSEGPGPVPLEKRDGGDTVPSVPPTPSPAPPPPPAPGYGYGFGYGQAPQYPGYPGGYGGWPPPGPAPRNGFGITALVLGIVAVIPCMWFWGVGIVVGAVGIVFGILGRGRVKRGEADNGGMALAGIILGAVGVAIGAVVLGFLIWAVQQPMEPTEVGTGDDTFNTSLVVPGD